MFQLLQSNDMHELVETFAARNASMPADPFEPLAVVVQSYGMGQWLKLQLAQRSGIAANIDCMLPANLIWRLYRHLLDDLEIPQASPYAIERLTWLIMRLLHDCTGDQYTQVRRFLDGSGDKQIRYYQLSEKIATLYDQYLIYRPDWILTWESGNTGADGGPDSWQRDLWLRINRDPGLDPKQHRAYLHRTLLDRLAGTLELPAGLPRQISVFGLSSLPVIHLTTLRALARHIDVDLYFLNPCQHYWGDIVSEKDLARRSVRLLLGKDESEDALVDEDYLDIGNPLLSSLGKQGREYLELLLDIDELETHEAFTVPAGDTMLALVKRDILNLEFGGEFGLDARPAPRPVNTDDLSLQIHACHSKMREVEVLHDQLLRIIATDGDVSPADIMVMMPDVSTYAPFIEAVFNRDDGQGRQHSHLHYTIADRSLNQESAVLVAFSTLLGLPDSRMTSTEVMDILEVPTIARKFNLFEEELLTLTHWVQDAGIRWELDGPGKRERWQVPASNQNTWQFGLDRLLLGFAMESETGPFEGILPLDLSAADGELLGTLCHFVELLADYRKKLLEPRSIGEWRDILLTMLDEFFDPRDTEELDLGLIRELLIRLEGEIESTAYDAPLSPRMLRYWFDQQLSISQQSRGFISGGITFATLVPMRSIPFKVVCLLGMNDGEYPREDRPPAFDLMQSEGYRKGDRSKRSDDRYLFLEALLSAERFFYISYEGRSVKDNQARPPSVLVSELIDYTTRIFDHDPVTMHPLQPFSEEYYSSRRPDLVTYRSEWYDALLSPSPVQTFVDVVFEDDPDLRADHISKLQQFFRHPARYFLRIRLGIYFEDDNIDLKDTESFTLDALERYQLADSALTALLTGESIEQWRQRAVASGFVMDGPIGRVQLDRQLAGAQNVYAAVADLIDVEAEWIQSVLYLPDKPGGIEGNVGPIYAGSILNYRSGTLRKRQVLEAWIAHLFANAVKGETITTLVSKDNDKVQKSVIEPLKTLDAKRQLVKLMDLYDEGMRSPLPFLPETSYEYISHQSAERALQTFQSDSAGAEGNDRNYHRLFSFPTDFDDRFREVAERIYLPLIEHWSGAK